MEKNIDVAIIMGSDSDLPIMKDSAKFLDNMGISYEIIRWAGRHDNWLSTALAAPGKALQRLTTSEPDDGMIECAIEAITLVIPEVKGQDEW